MFFWCVTIIKTDTTDENIIRDRTWFLVKTSRINSGKEIPAIIDPKETYLVMVNTIKKTPRADKAAGGWTAKTIPNNVCIDHAIM